MKGAEMIVKCRTNLDLHHAEKWPREMPTVPRVGDHIRSAMVHANGFHLSLQVCRVTWVPQDYAGDRVWIPEIELHLTDFHKGLESRKQGDNRPARGSIAAFYEWYAPLVGSTTGSFI